MINKILQTALVISLSAFQMEHIASVAGWKAAIIIEVGIVISSILKAHKPLTALLALSVIFVLSFHFDAGFTFSIKALGEILMALSVPLINFWMISEEVVGQEEGVPAVVPKTVPKKGASQKLSQALSQETLKWIKKLGQDGLSLRQIQDKTGVSKSTVGRVLQSA